MGLLVDLGLGMGLPVGLGLGLGMGLPVGPGNGLLVGLGMGLTHTQDKHRNPPAHARRGLTKNIQLHSIDNSYCYIYTYHICACEWYIIV